MCQIHSIRSFYDIRFETSTVSEPFIITQAGHTKGMSTSKSFSSMDLVKKAEEFVARFDVKTACKFYERALEMDSKNDSIMDALASACLEIGDVDRAEKLFRTSISIAPNNGYEKYLYMAQIVGGHEAVQFTLKGISLTNETGERKMVSASAYCSLAELYMTDLIGEKDSEQKCEFYVQKSIEMDGKFGIEPIQALASLRVLQSRKEEATDAMKKVLERLQTAMEKNNSDLIPEFGVRVRMVQLLVETNMAKEALSHIHILLHENDEVPNVWYLGGLAAKAAGEQKHAIELFTRARDMLLKAKTFLGEDAVKPQLDSIRALLLSCSTSIQQGGDNDDDV